MNKPRAAEPLLSVRHLNVSFQLRSGWLGQRRSIHAVDEFHLDLQAGETLGIVGESGSGKSTLARALCGLQAVQSGSIRIGGDELARGDKKTWRRHRRDLQLIFQDPLASLNPKHSVRRILNEPLQQLCPELDAAARTARIETMLMRVGLPPETLEQRPRELSGGQCQRIGIARALLVEPRILICDEPASALDVSVQAQIINLLLELRAELGLTLIFISHDLALVRHLSDRVLVMYFGRVVEQGPAAAVYSHPQHPYTRLLLASVPGVQGAPIEDRGEPPDPTQPPMGCAFHTRCPLVDPSCLRAIPHQRRVGAGHFAACPFGAPSS